MDAELREYLEALRAGQERLEGRIDALEGTIETQAQMLRAEMNDMETRLIKSIENRRMDEDIAFRNIAALEKRTDNVERRLKALEAHGG